MVSWKQRIATGLFFGPLIIYFLHYQKSSMLLCQFITFILHNEFSKIVNQILKFNSSESDNWYIDALSEQFIIRVPFHYYIIGTYLTSSDAAQTLHFIITILLICIIRLHHYLSLSDFISTKEKFIEETIPLKFLEKNLLQLTFFQISADLLQFVLFVFSLSFVILTSKYIQGPALNLIWIISAWQTDNGTLLIGSILGKHAYAPNISLKKTWEGLSGGLFLSVMTALILSQLNFFEFQTLDKLHTKHFLILSLLVSIISIFGDFVEKFLKRVANIENSSDILPGQKGVLDRMDSLCFSAPIIYLYMKIFAGSILEWNGE